MRRPESPESFSHESGVQEETLPAGALATIVVTVTEECRPCASRVSNVLVLPHRLFGRP